MMPTNHVHIVLSNVGGVGRTVVSLKIAEYLGAQVVDVSPSNVDIGNFKGLKNALKINKFYTYYKEDSQRYFHKIFEGISLFFKNKDNPSSVVLDLSSSMSISFLAMMQETKTFIDIYERDNISIHLHIIIATNRAEVSMLTLDYLGLKNSRKQLKNKISIWMNGFGDFLERKKDKEEEAIFAQDKEDRLRKIIGGIYQIGDGNEYSMKLHSHYLSRNQMTFSYLEKNREEHHCPELDFARIRTYHDKTMKAIHQAFIEIKSENNRI